MLRLEEVRKSKKISQMALADKAGIKQGYVSDLENGKRQPSFEVLIRLAKALGCTLDELVDIDAAS